MSLQSITAAVKSLCPSKRRPEGSRMKPAHPGMMREKMHEGTYPSMEIQDGRRSCRGMPRRGVSLSGEQQEDEGRRRSHPLPGLSERATRPLRCPAKAVMVEPPGGEDASHGLIRRLRSGYPRMNLIQAVSKLCSGSASPRQTRRKRSCMGWMGAIFPVARASR
jgi:hypothetical protein